MQHPDEGTIHAWLDDALDPAERASVAAHVAVCERCAALVAEARGMIAGASRITAMLDGVRGGVLPTSPDVPVARTPSLWTALRITPARAALAAGLLIAAAGVLTVRHDTPMKLVPHAVVTGPDMTGATASLDAPRSATPQPAAPASAPAPAPAPAPALMRAERAVRGAVAAEQTQAPAAGGPPPVRMLEQHGVAAPGVSTSSVVVSNSDSAPASRATTAVAGSAAATPTIAASATPAAARSAVPGALAADAHKAGVERTSHADSVMAGIMMTQAELRAREAFAPTNGANARNVMRLEQVMKSSASSSSAFAGCYRISADSVVWPRSLPTTFSLTAARAPNGDTRNVVRAVGADGRVDSAVAGTWRQVTPSMANVTFTSAALQPSLTLQVVGDAQLRGGVRAETRIATVPITRLECRPE